MLFSLSSKEHSCHQARLPIVFLENVCLLRFVTYVLFTSYGFREEIEIGFGGLQLVLWLVLVVRLVILLLPSHRRSTTSTSCLTNRRLSIKDIYRKLYLLSRGLVGSIFAFFSRQTCSDHDGSSCTRFCNRLSIDRNVCPKPDVPNVVELISRKINSYTQSEDWQTSEIEPLVPGPSAPTIAYMERLEEVNEMDNTFRSFRDKKL